MIDLPEGATPILIFGPGPVDGPVGPFGSALAACYGGSPEEAYRDWCTAVSGYLLSLWEKAHSDPLVVCGELRVLPQKMRETASALMDAEGLPEGPERDEFVVTVVASSKEAGSVDPRFGVIAPVLGLWGALPEGVYPTVVILAGQDVPSNVTMFLAPLRLEVPPDPSAS